MPITPLPGSDLTEENPLVLIPDRLIHQSYLDLMLEAILDCLRQGCEPELVRQEFLSFAREDCLPRYDNAWKHETWLAVHQRLFDRGYCEFLTQQLAHMP